MLRSISEYLDGHLPPLRTLLTDWPYVETKEHIGGFAGAGSRSLDETLEWSARPALHVGRRSEDRLHDHLAVRDKRHE